MAQPAAEPGLSAVVQSIKVSGPLGPPPPAAARCPPPPEWPARLGPARPVQLALAPLPQVRGYLNLLANTIDNFTHGLAVAASFLVSKKVSGGLGPAGRRQCQWEGWCLC